MTQIYEFLVRGGVIMIPILLGSVIALTIFLERIWSLQDGRVCPKSLVDAVINTLKEKNMGKAREECIKANTPMGRLLLSGLDAAKQPRPDLRDTMEEAGKREVAHMERYIEAMGTTASVEPLLGLLGTVIGMIKVFQQVVKTARQGAVDPSQLANGIWQALITTAAGLSVAILAFIGYRYLLSRTQRHTLVLEDAASRLVEAIHPAGSPSEEDK